MKMMKKAAAAAAVVLTAGVAVTGVGDAYGAGAYRPDLYEADVCAADIPKLNVYGDTAGGSGVYLDQNMDGSAFASEAEETAQPQLPAVSEVGFDTNWTYAGFSKINSGTAKLYRSDAAVRREKTVCVNAGHGTKGGSGVKTQCHPDGSPKVTGGTTGAGAISAVAVSSGMTFADGTPESQVTLAMALKLRDKLLADGYDVLIIRETEDVQLDNVARTVMANQLADCHISIHWDSTSSDKGAFYMSVPNVASYRNMEPVKSHWQEHHSLGDSLILGLRGAGVKIFSNGAMAMDLTQTSYSTVPSVDIELGDKVSDHRDASLEKLADGLLAGVNHFFTPSAEGE